MTKSVEFTVLKKMDRIETRECSRLCIFRHTEVGIEIKSSQQAFGEPP